MAITKKSTSALSRPLTDYQTWIVDTDSNSKYFRVSQIPEILTAGKNAFLINGSRNLVRTTEVLVELIDADGNVIFSQPITNYAEGLSRVVSIEVYPDIPSGLATLTILGQLREDENGQTPPPEFIDAYNVKWERKIPVIPTRGNISPIRLYQFPTASVSEVLNPLRQVSQSIRYVSGTSSFSIQGSPLRTAILSAPDVSDSYVIFASQPRFVKQMEGGELRVVVDGTGFTSSISTVINNRTLEIEPGYTSGSTFESFNSIDFTISYTGSPEYLVTEFTRSFADMRVKHLTTFSGDIYRVKAFVSSIDSPGSPNQIADTRVTPAELMVTSSYLDGEHKLRTGYFTDQSIPTNHWTIGTFPSMSRYNPLG